ncbi:hypothetical protein SKAU_G00374980 [Synaphobranchus kaupii]|uniref:Uncharacterized protein n=1 Tax=Synaphobranchus kaupii TaxID=118154 RepID=A0A9Q1EGT6_SYNKA|nr:hypothetical protein SKAU_G00374980 [Synaphobranchus kaupii]
MKKLSGLELSGGVDSPHPPDAAAPLSKRAPLWGAKSARPAELPSSAFSAGPLCARAPLERAPLLSCLLCEDRAQRSVESLLRSLCRVVDGEESGDGPGQRCCGRGFGGGVRARSATPLKQPRCSVGGAKPFLAGL